MSETPSPSSSEVLSSLKLLRSERAEDRRRGVAVLSRIPDEPRVMQVFEYLYEKDPDPAVREMVWRALSRQGPSVPAPAPARSPAAARAGAAAPARRTLFLLDPAHREIVLRHMRHKQPSNRQPGCLLLALVGLLLFAAGVFWGLAAPAWYDWYQLREDGVQTEAAITGLSAPAEDGGRAVATYRFRLPDAGGDEADDTDDVEAARVYAGQQTLTEDAFRWLSENPEALLPVTYDAGDPTRSRLEVGSPDELRRERLAIVAGGLSAIALLVGVLGWIVRLPRAKPRGRLLRGQVLEARTRIDPEGAFELTVRYRFLSPGRRVIVSEATRARNDLINKPLPARGTPVLVEYRSERVFRLL